MSLDIERWIDQEENPRHRKERQVIHIILDAISQMGAEYQVALKGGVLIALIYGSSRHTRDIDFSTKQKYKKNDEAAFIAELDRKLMSVDHNYPVRVMIQSHEVQPPKPPQSFPTLKIKIGYADRVIKTP